MKFALAFIAVALVAGVQSITFEITNSDGGEIWVGIQGNPGHDHLEGGGFALAQGATRYVSAPDDWAGRFWSRTWCDPNTNHCETGDCGNRLACGGAGGNPPASLVEITLKGDQGLDFYDVSLVDGFNSRASIEPLGGEGDGSQYSCKHSGCHADVNGGCPAELQIHHDGYIIACASACLVFNTDEYCCRGDHGVPENCKSSDWPVDYPAYFKNLCPDAYSYAYDDHKSTFTCRNVPTYRIIFGA